MQFIITIEMCYSYESSIYAWVISFVIGVIILFFYDDKTYRWFAVFLLTFTQIQIYEAVIWTTMSIDTNYMTTKLLFFALWLQPLVNCVGAYNSTNKKMLLLMAIYYLFVIIYSYIHMKNDYYFTIIGNNNSLVWIRNNKQCYFLSDNTWIAFSYLVGIFLPYLFLESREGIILFVYISLTYIYSKINYFNEYASIWCYVSVNYGLVVLLMMLYRKFFN